jgi:hypothetical protein
MPTRKIIDNRNEKLVHQIKRILYAVIWAVS